MFCLLQGFRKYLTQSKDHEELLAFLLGGLVKDKARFHQLQRHEQPDTVTIKLTELEERVRPVCELSRGILANKLDFRRKNMISLTYLPS